MHDIESDTAPSFFKKQFQNTRSIHQHLTRGHNLNFHLSHTLAESKILKNATLMWKTLPENVKLLNKQKLKKKTYQNTG